jgi:hypothetical protein
MIRTMMSFGLLLLLVAPGKAADAAYTIKTADAEVPKEVQEPVGKLLSNKCIQFSDAKGLLAELWFRKEVPAKATPEQVKNGLTYKEVQQGTILGVVRVAQQSGDYRKQKIKPGVFTIRLAIQPMDGDHMGTAPYGEFGLLIPAGEDKGDNLEPKKMHEMSMKASGTGHPAVFLLFPAGEKDVAGAPKLVDKGEGHWVLMIKLDADASGKKATLGLGLTLIGFSSQA